MSNILKVIKHSNQVSEVVLSRAEVHNAFNSELINELTNTFLELDKDNDTNIIVLTGEGKSFCAGADLNWMSSMVNFSKEENIDDSQNLYRLFETINNTSKLVIGKVNGHALGGGVGLVSCCDVVITHEKAKFGFTEVKLGLVPATISPFCIAKIGESNARAYFMSGEIFDAQKAKEIGLVHHISSVESFEDDFQELVKKYLQAGPMAQMKAKELIRNVLTKTTNEAADYTCDVIAEIRISNEGQEGMSALLEKRKPNWIKDGN